MERYVIGLDFGSDSARAIVIDADSGNRLGTGIGYYKRWAEGKYCNPAMNIFRQHPYDFLEAMEDAVHIAVKKAGKNAGDKIKAIAIDSTGSTIAPMSQHGDLLCMHEKYSETPDAMFYMWKDHSAKKEAKYINDVLANSGSEDYTRFQGSYSAEWFWAKILYAKHNNPQIADSAWTWIELSDWIPNLLSGIEDPSKLYRNICAAGHKALWHSDFNGLPPRSAFMKIDPYLAKVAERYGGAPRPASAAVGKISPEWAERLGLNRHVIIGGSSLDAHAGAVGAGIKPQTLVKVIGTSTVDMLIAPKDVLRGKNIKDFCGQAEDSIVPEYIGIESGQAAFGDIMSWYKKILYWSIEDFCSFLFENGFGQTEAIESLKRKYDGEILQRLTNITSKQEPDQDLVALDWLNGRRYPMINETVKGMMSGISLGTGTTDIFQALAMSAVFGSRRIFDSLQTRGIVIDKIIASGTVTKKSPLIMQMMADSLGKVIELSDDDEVCAVGAAINATVAAGIYPNVFSACDKLCAGYSSYYSPDLKRKEKLDKYYRRYLNLARHSEMIDSETGKEF